MSELTPCNWHTLQGMKARARKRGTEVIVTKITEGDFAGWTSARFADQETPAAYFMELTERCAC